MLPALAPSPESSCLLVSLDTSWYIPPTGLTPQSLSVAPASKPNPVRRCRSFVSTTVGHGLTPVLMPSGSRLLHRWLSFFSIQIDGEPAGNIIFKLYDDVVPKTARNFRELATGQNPGKSYQASGFHRM